MRPGGQSGPCFSLPSSPSASMCCSGWRSIAQSEIADETAGSVIYSPERAYRYFLQMAEDEKVRGLRPEVIDGGPYPPTFSSPPHHVYLSSDPP